MINNIDIWINPLANPDGTYAGGNNSVNGAQRYNANYVDLNRNYRDPADGPHPDGEEWQPETVAFMNFAEDRDFVMSANFHGGTEVINYPWDTWSRFAADDEWWQLVSHEYADTCQAHSPSNYMNEFDDGITNGYAWYRITGGRQDYMNYFQQCREVTMEISDVKLIPASQLLKLDDLVILVGLKPCTCPARDTKSPPLTTSPVVNLTSNMASTVCYRSNPCNGASSAGNNSPDAKSPVIMATVATGKNCHTLLSNSNPTRWCILGNNAPRPSR